MKILAGLLLALPLAGCAASIEAVPPNRQVPPPTPGSKLQEVHVHIRSGGARVGCYTVVVKWDPHIAVIDRIAPCAGSKFPGAAQFPPSNFTKGQIRIWGITTQKNHDVPDEYDLVTVWFKPLHAGRVPVTVTIEALYDAMRKPRPVSGQLNVFPPELDFPE
jgi:hypothetical protein